MTPRPAGKKRGKATRRRVAKPRPSKQRQTALAVLQKRLAEQAIELDEVRKNLVEVSDQQRATAEVLNVISRSAFNLQAVLNKVVESAVKLCHADHGWLFQPEGECFRWAASFGNSDEEDRKIKEYYASREIRAERGSITGRCALERRAFHVADVLADAEYTWAGAQAIAGYRAALGVPLLRENNVVGVIFLYKKVVQPFTEKQIQLVASFADQAVIAIENFRLLSELRESLQQQTATADVLKVISRSTFDLQTVLDALTQSAARLCEADMSAMTRDDGSGYRHVTNFGYPADWVEFNKTIRMQAGRGSIVGRVLLEGKAVQVADVLADPEYTYSEPQKKAGYRTFLGVPLLRERKPIGVLTLARRNIHPFTIKQIELVQTFADQAVIAIENVRLFDEVQKRTEDLSESLQQQTATAEVLKVISRSTFDLQTVLDALTSSAASLSVADMAAIIRVSETGNFYHVTNSNFSPEWIEFSRNVPMRAGRGSVVGRALLEGRVVQVADVLADPEYMYVEPAKKAGYRTYLAAPMLREGEIIGVLALGRRRVATFSERQVELISTFADQAAIAIENVRLFDEIQEKSRQLAEASQHKSQFLANMSHELRTPLNAILGYTELIIDGIYGETPEKAQAVLKRVESNGKHLLGLINDVLDLSKIEAGQLKLTLTDYSIRDVVHGVHSALEPLATKKNLNLKVALPNSVPGAHGDERKLTQVLLNLVGNAIKFTDQGEVAIHVAAENGTLSIAIRDTGPGIAPADQARLFEEFQQADSSITKKKGGTGLGLAISKRIIEMHGGQIILESSVGHGSTFKVALPIQVERQVSLS